MLGSPKSGCVIVCTYIAIILSCPLIGWLSQWLNSQSAQHNYNKEPDFEVPVFVLLKNKSYDHDQPVYKQ